jgi:hypothetical protein
MTAQHRNVILVFGVFLLTGLAFLGGWVLSRKEQGTPPSTAQAEELAQLRREVQGLREVLGEQPSTPGGIRLAVTEKAVVPSRMPARYADYLNPAHPDCILDRKDVGAADFAVWHFYAGQRGGESSKESMVFLIATDPVASVGMMDGLDGLNMDLVRQFKVNRTGCLLGRKKLEALNLKPNDRLHLTGLNHQGVDLELEVMGILPGKGYEQMGLMNAEYLTAALEARRRKTGEADTSAGRSLNIVWLRVPNRAAFERVKRTVEDSPLLSQPRVICRMADSLPFALLPEADR